MLTALSVARDSGMIAPNDRVLLLTAQNATGTDQKLSMQWSPISDIHDCTGNDRPINVDDIEIRQVCVNKRCALFMTRQAKVTSVHTFQAKSLFVYLVIQA